MNGAEESTFDVELFWENIGKNRSLSGRPKILIFDFCRGGDVNLGELKASLIAPRIPFGSDIFIGFATTKGYASATGTDGSPFIAAFCNCIEESYDKESFVNIFQEVQHVVSSKKTTVREPTKGEILDSVQVPESRSTLRNQLYLLDKSKELYAKNKAVLAQLIPFTHEYTTLHCVFRSLLQPR